jgi:glutamine cyclotransferase
VKRWQLAGAVVVAVFVFGVVVYALLNGSSPSLEPLNYTYRVVNVYPHDADAFTQGLVFDDGVMYEGTGLYGESSLRRVDLESGEVLQSYNMSDEFFGEGIAVVDDKIVQLTWRSNVGFVYDKHSFDLLQEFSYPTEGWGVTYDGSRLIMSDGSANLYFLDPVSFERIGQIEVRDVEAGPVARLNELECVEGYVYANIWYDERIAVIDPGDGRVVGWVDLGGLRDLAGPGADVLNGIAYDVEGGRLFVTGKRWSKLFEIELILSE